MPEPGQPPRLRGEAADEALRERLEPLAPGERPRIFVVAAVVCLLFSVVNAVGAATAPADDRPLLIGLVALGVALAAGIWRVQYWAAMGVQIAAAVTAVSAFLALLLRDDPVDIALGVLTLVGSATLFWRMVRPLGRMQAPPRG